jgi:hypothetical protein
LGIAGIGVYTCRVKDNVKEIITPTIPVFMRRESMIVDLFGISTDMDRGDTP